MKVTFGIITTPETQVHLPEIIRSIESQKIPSDSYEIILVGNCNIKNSGNVRVVPFNEGLRPRWITRKKNIVTEEARYENIVYIHDYIAFSPDWYSGFLKFGTDWDICMNPVKNHIGERLLDWMGLPDDPIYGNVVLPYDYPGSDGMYINGHYWIAKKDVMIEFPLNEDLLWGDGEDVEWSKRVLGGFPPPWLKNHKDILNGEVKVKKHKYCLNLFSSVFTLKPKFYSPGFFEKYDMHSGDESRPLPSTPENYEYLKYRKVRNV